MRDPFDSGMSARELELAEQRAVRAAQRARVARAEAQAERVRAAYAAQRAEEAV